LSYFSQSKGDKKGHVMAVSETKPGDQRASSTDTVSTLGPGMSITGNIVCAGSVQILGRVNGDIQAAQLTICEGAQVEGTVTAQETVISGSFKGTIHGNSVKLRSTAVVDGEIFNKSLTIDENAQFEGVSRRLDKAIEPPSSAETPAKPAAMSATMPGPGSTADIVQMPKVAL